MPRCGRHAVEQSPVARCATMKLPSANLRLAGVYCLLWALAGTTSAVACICNGPPRVARNAALFERALRASDIAETEVTALVAVTREDFAHQQRASFVVDKVWRGAVQPGASYSAQFSPWIAGCAKLVNVGERSGCGMRRAHPAFLIAIRSARSAPAMRRLLNRLRSRPCRHRSRVGRIRDINAFRRMPGSSQLSRWKTAANWLPG